MKVVDLVEDENLQVLLIKNLDTNEVMQIPLNLEDNVDNMSGRNSYGSHRKGLLLPPLSSN
jgi:hypothetical protein